MSRLFHGSPYAGIRDDFSNFETRKGAAFFTASLRVAKEYTKPLMAAGAKPAGNVKLDPTVYTCDVKPRRVFDLRTRAAREDWDGMRAESKKDADVDDWLPALDKAVGRVMSSGLPSYALVHTLRPLLISRGYDSCLIDEGSQGSSLALFDWKGKVKVLTAESLSESEGRQNPQPLKEIDMNTRKKRQIDAELAMMGMQATDGPGQYVPVQIEGPDGPEVYKVWACEVEAPRTRRRNPPLPEHMAHDSLDEIARLLTPRLAADPSEGTRLVRKLVTAIYKGLENKEASGEYEEKTALLHRLAVAVRELRSADEVMHAQAWIHPHETFEQAARRRRGTI